MKTFEIGQTYFMRSSCDYDCIWTYEVVARTAKTVTLKRRGQTQRCRINTSTDYEYCAPLGRFSMSPILAADQPVEEEMLQN